MALLLTSSSLAKSLMRTLDRGLAKGASWWAGIGVGVDECNEVPGLLGGTLGAIGAAGFARTGAVGCWDAIGAGGAGAEGASCTTGVFAAIAAAGVAAGPFSRGDGISDMLCSRKVGTLGFSVIPITGDPTCRVAVCGVRCVSDRIGDDVDL